MFSCRDIRLLVTGIPHIRQVAPEIQGENVIAIRRRPRPENPSRRSPVSSLDCRGCSKRRDIDPQSIGGTHPHAPITRWSPGNFLQTRV